VKIAPAGESFLISSIFLLMKRRSASMCPPRYFCQGIIMRRRGAVNVLAACPFKQDAAVPWGSAAEEALAALLK
jgi:hypothetical protein